MSFRNPLSQLFCWCTLGAFSLLLVLTTLLVQLHMLYRPLVIVACLGFILTWKWKKWGVVLSTLSLAGVALFCAWPVDQHGWISLFSAAIFTSWMLTFLGQQEAAGYLEKQEEKAMTAERRERELHAALAQAQKTEKRAAELDRLQHELCMVNEKLSQEVEKSTALSQEIANYQEREKAFELALEQVRMQKEEESEGEESREVHLQLMQLRRQFEDKSEILHQTRKELFSIENQLLALQKECKENQSEQPEVEEAMAHQLLAMEEERAVLEQQVQDLEAFISELLAPKKAARPRKVRAKKESLFAEELPLLLQEKMVKQSESRVHPQ